MAIATNKTELILKNKVIANLPKPKTSGTYTQYLMYCKLTAEKIAKQASEYFKANKQSIVFDYEKDFIVN